MSKLLSHKRVNEILKDFNTTAAFLRDGATCTQIAQLLEAERHGRRRYYIAERLLTRLRRLELQQERSKLMEELSK